MIQKLSVLNGGRLETLVQCFQYLDKGAYDKKPNVDFYLVQQVENTALPDGLRTCAARVGRSIYTFRNKRNIAHTGEVDPNAIDLAYVHHAASWIMAELLRQATGTSMQEAGALIELVQAPVGTLVEDIGDTRLVHANVGVKVELLILLHSHYPNVVSRGAIRESLSRRSEVQVGARLTELHAKKLIHGSSKDGFRLTRAGYDEASAEISKLVD